MSGSKGESHKTVGITVVGAGRIGDLHARNIVSRVSGLELRCVVEPSPRDEFSEWAESSGVEIVPSFEEALKHGTDAVLIAVPTDLHESIALAAAGAGVHIFCEKPVAPDIAAARRAVAAAEQAGVVFQVGFNRRFDHNFHAIRTAVAEGRVGAVEMIRVTSRDPAPPGIDYVRRSGGLFMDMMIHDFDMARFLSGEEFVEVFARGVCRVDPGIGEAGDIDTAVVSFETAAGSIGFIENSRRASYGYDQRAEILGSGGAVSISNDAPSTVTISDDRGTHGEKPQYFFLERYRDSFVSELEAFARAVARGSQPDVSGRDGIEAMRIAAACNLSLSEGRAVRLSEIE